jgi:hypothetical protein
MPVELTVDQQSRTIVRSPFTQSMPRRFRPRRSPGTPCDGFAALDQDVSQWGDMTASRRVVETQSSIVTGTRRASVSPIHLSAASRRVVAPKFPAAQRVPSRRIDEHGWRNSPVVVGAAIAAFAARDRSATPAAEAHFLRFAINAPRASRRAGHRCPRRN